MEQTQAPEPQKTQQNRFVNWLKTSITARMLMVGFLVIVLLIPLAYINSLIKERAYRQQDVVKEINTKWGKEVLVYGPILKLPYKTYAETKTYNEKTKTYYTQTETHYHNAYIFPKDLDINANIKSDLIYLGNYESAVYSTDINFKGNFIAPTLESKDIKPENILWDKASILIQTSNLKGIKTELNIKLNNESYGFDTNFKNSNNYYAIDELETGYLNKDLLKTDFSFQLTMTYNGSNNLQFIPVGKTTDAKITSDWADPKFIGTYAPNNDTKKITETGFEADWKVLHINRPFSQIHLENLPELREYAFGTQLIVLVDEYQKSERSAKYGFLVIALTFLIFFLIQTISKIHIHPFQYLMIGLALTMFYTLLVSISEHSNFLKAYLTAGVSVVLLITLYSKSILKSIKFSALIGISLTALYSFIYVIIQLQNYALLVGSIGLFVILASVMFISRKIDWAND